MPKPVLEKWVPKKSLKIRVEWDAAHFLPKYQGACQRLHGHRWVLDVTATGPIDKASGFIVDFKRLKDIVKKYVVDVYDHQLINDFMENPTAEDIIEDVAKRLKLGFNQGNLPIILTKLELWETPNSSCIWEA